MSLYVFGGLVLLVLAIELIKQYWWALATAALVTAVTAIAIWWLRRKNTWS